MEFIIPQEVRSDFEGYYSLIKLNHAISNNQDNNIILNFKNNTWFEANLFAILGAFRSKVKEQKRKLSIINTNSILQSVIQRNKFLKGHRGTKVPVLLGTIVTYKKFTSYEDIEFMNYILNELLSKPAFPKHSILLGKKINESIFEIFENARTHGHCKYIHTCGQYYPNETIKRLDMTIVDMGNTIKANVNDFTNKNLSGSEAIEWALIDGNTTKTGNIPGGLGLNIIFEFIQLNKGKIQIVSSDGYWEYSKGESENKLFDYPFPGTIVNIEFNLDDKDYYQLIEEVSLEGIF